MRIICAFFVFAFLMSCKDDPGPIVRLVENNDLIIDYQCMDGRIEFTVDVLSDLTDSTNIGNLNHDFFYLYVDVNSNGSIDPNEDFLLNLLNDGRACLSRLTADPTIISACEFSNDWVGISNFGSSSEKGDDHVIHTLSIKKDVLSTSQQANVILHVYDSNFGWYYYPQQDIDFQSTLQLSW